MGEQGKKSLIRDAVRTRRQMLTSKQVKYYGDVFAEQFLESEDDDLIKAINECKCIALYSAVRGELPCDGVADYFLKKGVRVCYPVVKGREMDFYEVKSLSSMKKGAYGIPEPDTDCPKVEPGEIDIMIVPAIAYNDEGIRLGQGGGYYDKYVNAALNQAKYPLLVGACYDFQIYSALPVEPHDIAVDMIMCVYTGDDE